MSARPPDASVAPVAPVAPVAQLALCYNESSTQANVQHVENSHRGMHVLVAPANSDAPGATGSTGALRLRRNWNWNIFL